MLKAKKVNNLVKNKKNYSPAGLPLFFTGSGRITVEVLGSWVKEWSWLGRDCATGDLKDTNLQHCSKKLLE